MDPARVKHSMVWNFFTPIESDGGTPPGPGVGSAASNAVGGVARCRLCQSLIRQKNANTTNLWSHLKSNHPELYPPPIAAAAAAVAEQQQMQVRPSRRSASAGAASSESEHGDHHAGALTSPPSTPGSASGTSSAAAGQKRSAPPQNGEHSAAKHQG